MCDAARVVLKMAWRSIWRNRRRTLITMSAVGIGLFLIIVYSGFLSGFLSDAKNQMDNTGMGHVEIYAKDYRLQRKAALAIRNPGAVMAALELPEGAEVGARVLGQGLVSSAWGSRGVRLYGVDPTQEALLSGFVTALVDGEPLRRDDSSGVLVGEKLAERLRLKPGSKVRLMLQRADGEMGAELLRVRGIFHAMAAPISLGQVYVARETSLRLLGLDDAAHQIAIQLARPEQAEALAATLRTRLGAGYEVLTYGDLLPILKQMEDLMGNVVLIVAFCIYFLVGLGILNTILMSVLERTREFGVMMAIGTRPRRIVTLVLAESFWIATLSVLLGLAAGLALTWYGSEHALLDWTEVIGESFEMGGAVMSSVMRTEFSLLAGLQATGIVWSLTLMVGLVPAWKVSKLQPAEALRSV